MEKETRNKILYGAGELIMKYGIHSISMDEISHHLSISKKTVYQHFKNKEELLLQISVERLKAIKQTFARASQEASNAIEETALISTCLCKHKQELSAATLFDAKKYYPKVYAVWRDFQYNYIRQYIIRNINNGIKEGLFRAEIKPDVMSLMRVLCIEAVCNGTTFADTKQSMAELHEQLFEHFLLGLCTDKGRKLFSRHKNTI